MPIKGDAKKVKDSMEEQYGKEKGEDVFYATANKQDRSPETWKKKGADMSNDQESPIGKKDKPSRKDKKEFGPPNFATWNVSTDSDSSIRRVKSRTAPLGGSNISKKKPASKELKKAAATLRAIVKGAKCKRDAKRAPDDDEIAAKHKKEAQIGPVAGGAIGATAGGLAGGALGGLRGGLTGATAGVAGGILWYLIQKMRGKRKGFWEAVGEGTGYGALGGGGLGAISGGLGGAIGGGIAGSAMASQLASQE